MSLFKLAFGWIVNDDDDIFNTGKANSDLLDFYVDDASFLVADFIDQLKDPDTCAIANVDDVMPKIRKILDDAKADAIFELDTDNKPIE